MNPECKKVYRNLYRYKDKLLCYNCYKKSIVLMPWGTVYEGKTIKEALNKIYEIKGSLSKEGYLKSHPLGIPKCLIRKKIKLILTEDEN